MNTAAFSGTGNPHIKATVPVVIVGIGLGGGVRGASHVVVTCDHEHGIVLAGHGYGTNINTSTQQLPPQPPRTTQCRARPVGFSRACFQYG